MFYSKNTLTAKGLPDPTCKYQIILQAKFLNFHSEGTMTEWLLLLRWCKPLFMVPLNVVGKKKLYHIKSVY